MLLCILTHLNGLSTQPAVNGTVCSNHTLTKYLHPSPASWTCHHCATIELWSPRPATPQQLTFQRLSGPL